MRVVAVNISKKKGEIKHSVSEVNTIENYGIEGDAHAGKGIRQISLLGVESINRFSEQTKLQGLCSGKFAENITTEGITLYTLPIGTRLKIGESIQEVTKIGKECHFGCEIAKQVGACIMPKEGIFTKVIKGGKIKAGDSIEILKNDLCIMLGYDEATEQHLTDMQNKLYQAGFRGTHNKDLPQHITLGIFPWEERARLMALIEQVAERHNAFDITFNHIGVFGGAKVLFIAPDANTNLLAVKEQFGTSHNWTPHSTMLIDESEKIYQALQILANDFVAFQGKVCKIYLYEFWPARSLVTLDLKHEEK